MSGTSLPSPCTLRAVTQYDLGLALAQYNHDRHVTRRYHVLAVASALAVLALAGYTNLDSAYTFGSAVILLILTLAFASTTFSRAQRERISPVDPLSGSDCVRMRDLSLAHTEIASMLVEIRAQGRTVAALDLWRAQEWLGAAALREQQLACKQINGVVALDGDATPARKQWASMDYW